MCLRGWGKLVLAAGCLSAGARAQSTITASPTSLSFRFQLASATLPVSQLLQITSTPPGVSYTTAVSGSPFNAAWLLLSASGGKAPASLRVQVNPTGLPAGSYSGLITLTATTGAPPAVRTVAVTMVVFSGPPTITASPGTLNVGYTTGGPIPDPSLTSSFVLSSTGTPLSAVITTSTASWLKVIPTGNISLVGLLNTVGITVDPTGLVPKSYNATITISAAASANKTVTVAVVLTVNAAPPGASATWPAGVIQGAPQTTATVVGSRFYSTSTVAATGFTPAATITVTDSVAATAVETLSLPVYAAGSTVLRIAVASPLPSGTVGTAYSQTLAAAGGTGPYAWSLVSGALPPGIAIAAALLTGTPTAAASYSFALAVTDSSTSGPAKAYQAFKLTIDPSGSTLLRILVAAATLPAGTVGAAYSQTLTAAGGTGPYTWSAVNLPAGLSLSAAGVLSGTPSSVGLTGPLTASLVSETALLVTVPAAMLVSAGTLRIGVTTPAPGGGTSNDAQFAVFGPEPQISAVVNSASFRQGTIAAGEIVTIFGSGLGPATLTLFDPSAPPIPTSLPTAGAATSVMIGGIAARLIYTSDMQIAAIVPFTIVGASAQVIVTYSSLPSLPFTVAVAPTDPGVYALDSSGQGQGAILNFNAATGDYTINSNINAAARGAVVVIYATGAGLTSPVVSTTLIPAAPAVVPVQAPTVLIGGQAAAVAAAQSPVGSVPGLLQLNVTVPLSLTAGSALPVLVTIGGVDSQSGVTMAVR